MMSCIQCIQTFIEDMNTVKLCRHENKTLDLGAGYRYEKINKKPLSTSDYKVSSGPIKGDAHYDAVLPPEI